MKNCHSRVGGNPETKEYTYTELIWIPAFAGMTKQLGMNYSETFKVKEKKIIERAIKCY